MCAMRATQARKRCLSQHEDAESDRRAKVQVR